MTNVQANPAIMLCFSAKGMYRLVSFTAAKIRKKHHGGNISKEKVGGEAGKVVILAVKKDYYDERYNMLTG